MTLNPPTLPAPPAAPARSARMMPVSLSDAARSDLRKRYFRLLARIPLRLRRTLLYARRHHRLPRFEAPRTFNEKLGWRILHDRRDELVWTCDKQRMKQHAAERSPGVAIPQTLWFGTDLEALERIELPDRWILKPNHRCGSLVHRGSGQPDAARLVRETHGWLGGRQSTALGEWAYDAARRAFLVEEWLGEADGSPPGDYKVYLFDGVPAFIEVTADRFSSFREVLVAPDWRPFEASYGDPALELPERPALWDELLRVASEIAAGFDFLRVDLYVARGRVWFGEVTPYSAGGLDPFTDRRIDERLGAMWRLPELDATGRAVRRASVDEEGGTS